MDNPEGKPGDFRFTVKGEITFLEVLLNVPGAVFRSPCNHAYATEKFLSWLRKLPSEQQMKIFSALVLEYGLGFTVCPPDIEKHMSNLSTEIAEPDNPEDFDEELVIDDYPDDSTVE